MLALLKILFRKSFSFFVRLSFLFSRFERNGALPKAKETIVSGGKVKACSPDLFNCFGFPSTTMPAMRYGLWEPDARLNTSRLPSLFFTAQPHARPLTSHSSEKATRIGATYLRFEIHMIL
ncbi:hypothetical protein ACB092_01G300400 [Castanea dentata]